MDPAAIFVQQVDNFNGKKLKVMCRVFLNVSQSSENCTWRLFEDMRKNV